MLHAQLRPVTIYIWQRMAASTEHLCGWGPPPTCLAPRASIAASRPLLAPCQPPCLRAQPFCLPWAEPGTLTEAPQACYWMISPPFPARHPPPQPLQGPSSGPCIPSSARRQVRAAGSRQAPLSSSCRGSPGAVPVGKPAHGSPLSEWDRGSGCSNPQQRRPCPARCSRAAGLEPSSAQQRSALQMRQFWVHPASSLAHRGRVL